MRHTHLPGVQVGAGVRHADMSEATRLRVTYHADLGRALALLEEAILQEAAGEATPKYVGRRRNEYKAALHGFAQACQAEGAELLREEG